MRMRFGKEYSQQSSSMDTTFIYALKCPTSGGVRYVGKANNPKRRFNNHLCEKIRSHRKNWITSLSFQGLKPVLEIVDEVPVIEWPMWEVAYIQFFKDEGCELVNGTLGGEGGPLNYGNKHMCGRKQSPETIAKRIASMTGQKRSLETRIKQSLAAKGKIRSAEHSAAISAAKIGTVVSVETRRKMSESSQRLSGENHHMFGRKHSAETRAKMTASQLKRNQ